MINPKKQHYLVFVLCTRWKMVTKEKSFHDAVPEHCQHERHLALQLILLLLTLCVQFLQLSPVIFDVSSRIVELLLQALATIPSRISGARGSGMALLERCHTPHQN